MRVRLPDILPALMRGFWNPESVRFPLAGVVGVLWALAFPLPGWAGLAWIAPALLFFGTLGLSAAGAFRFGYVAGLVHYVVLLRWMRHMPVSVGAYAAWMALAAYCALFPALWTWLGHRLLGPSDPVPGPDPLRPEVPRPEPSGIFERSVRTWLPVARGYALRPWGRRAGLLVALAASWVVLEWLRAHLLTGFPWAPLGMSQWKQLPLIQIASVTGVYGVSFLVCWCGLAIGGAMLTLGVRPESRWSWTAEARLPLALTLMVMGWGFWEVMGYRRLEALAGRETVSLALVQPSVPQTLLWDVAEEGRTFAKIETLSRQALALKPRVLVWPEGSFGLDQAHFGRMQELLSGTGADWVFGADDSERTEGRIRRFNAAFLRQADGILSPVYRKRRLVAFGEYVPLARWLPFLKWVTPIGDGFDPGDQPVAFRFGTNAVAAPVICFEDVFPHGIRDHVTAETDFVLVLTNDGWFSDSAAQWQHTAAAVFRAVENGVAVVRACNNGLTGWWDARGTPRNVLGEPKGDVHAAGVLLAEVPVGLPYVETPYHRNGDVFAGVCAALVGWRLVRGRLGPGRALPG